MKKVLSIFLVFTFVLLLTGCGSKNKVTCVYPGNDEGREKLAVELDADDKVEKVTAIIEFKSEDTAKEYMKKLNSKYKDYAKVVRNTIEINNLENEYSYKNLVGKTKDEFIKYAKSLSSGVTCE
jgi:uncharacterized lipoprotein YehR (DUF1307 family)